MADEKKAPAADAPAQDAPATATGAAQGLDETVPGGKYKTAYGDWVDAEGNPVKG